MSARRLMMLAAIVIGVSVAPLAHAQTPPFLFKWGGFGSGPGLMNRPMGVAVEWDGSVLVADAGNRRVDLFTPDGIYNTVYLNFHNPYAVACDAGEHIFTTDPIAFKIFKFGPEGPSAWGGVMGCGGGSFSYPIGIATTPNGRVYVCDLGCPIVQCFNSTGSLLFQFGSYGNGDGQFRSANGVAVAPNGDVYVSDQEVNRIERFTANGVYLGQFGTPGAGAGQFRSPHGLAVDASGRVYVCDEGNHRVQIFSAQGGFITQFGTYGGADGQFASPSGVALDSHGGIFVCDADLNRVQKFGGLTVATRTPSWGELKLRYR